MVCKPPVYVFISGEGNVHVHCHYITSVDLSHQDSSLPHLKPNVHADLKQQLRAYYRDIRFRFASYVDFIFESLQKRGITTERLRTFLLYLPAFDVSHDNPNISKEKCLLLAEARERLEKAESVYDIFTILSSDFLTSYLNYGIFELMIRQFRLDDSQQEMKYPEYFRAYVEKHKISEFMEINPQLSEVATSSKEFVFKMDYDLNHTPLAKITELKEAIANALKLKSSALRLLSIEEGCVVVKFLVSASIAELVFPFTTEQLKVIRGLSVTWLKLNGKCLNLANDESAGKKRRNNFRQQPRSNLLKDTLHVSIKGQSHSLPSSINASELRQFFADFDSGIKGVVIVWGRDLVKIGKVTFTSISVSSQARKALHGRKLTDGSCLNVRYLRKEDEANQSSVTPGTYSKGEEMVVEDPLIRTLHVKINDSQFPNVQEVNKRHLQLHFDEFKDDIEVIQGVFKGSNGEFAYVRFKTRSVAAEAISCLDHSALSNGRILYLSFKKPKQKNSLAAALPRHEPISVALLPRQEPIGATALSKQEPVSRMTACLPPQVEVPTAAENKYVVSDVVVLGYNQIVLGSFYEPICSLPEIVECKRTLLDRFKAVAECSCESSSGALVVSQAFLRIKQSHVVTIKIVVGNQITEKTDAVVIPTERVPASSGSYPIATERPSFMVDRSGWSSKNLCFLELVEIGETACLEAEHLACSHIIQVLLPLSEQKSANNLSCDEAVRNSVTHATQMRFGAIAFPGIKPQMVNSLVLCLSAVGLTTLHTISIVLRTESEAAAYSVVLENHVPSSTGNDSRLASKKSYSEIAQGPTPSASAVNSSQSQPPSSSEFVWSWRENDGSYIPYKPDVMKALNDAYKQDSDNTYFFTTNRTNYCVNFKRMKQINLMTSGERKIRKSENNNDNSNVTWKYRDDYDHFTSYTPGDSAQVEAMFQKKDDINLVINKRTYRFDFTTMKQINIMTGYQRDIFREVGSIKNESAVPGKPVFLCNGEVIVNIKGPLNKIAEAKKMFESKLKSLLFSKTTPVPAESNQLLLSKVQTIAKKHKVSCTVGEGGESEASNVSKQALTIEGLKGSVETAWTEILELIVAFRASFDHLPKPDQSGDQYPSEWAPMSAQEQVKYFQLSRSSSEYNRVCKKFEATMNGKTVIQIEQVQNKHLWTRYQQTKVRLHKKDPLNVNEKELFHGTRDKPAQTICSSEEGFDMRFSREGLWGQANYFAVKASYSDTFSYHDNSKQANQMILARVLTGDSITCGSDKSLRMPPEKKQGAGVGQLQQVRYDSVNGTTHGSQVFMTYANDLAYPAFIITYTSAALAPAYYQPAPARPVYHPPPPQPAPAYHPPPPQPTPAYHPPPPRPYHSPPPQRPKPSSSNKQSCTIS